MITKRVPLKQVERPDAAIPGRVLGEEKRAPRLNYEDRYTSTATVEFRDAYYAKLNQRMDEWMEKVNNLSLRDVNRFQFRKGRSAEPDFQSKEQVPILAKFPLIDFHLPVQELYLNYQQNIESVQERNHRFSPIP